MASTEDRLARVGFGKYGFCVTRIGLASTVVWIDGIGSGGMRNGVMMRGLVSTEEWLDSVRNVRIVCGDVCCELVG